ncbi:MAG: tRNA (adenosine(37)-N6)-dimethylallyltransferase MiaA [Nitrospinota bacterium]
MNKTAKKRLIVIGGATASGKSDVAAILANKVGGEVVSADSIQVYKHFNIGAGKPSDLTRQLAPHHMLDFVNPEDEFNIVKFRSYADPIIAEIFARGKIALIAGGSGLYIKALTDRLSGAAKVSSEANEKVEEIVKEKGLAQLYKIACDIDPERTKKIHPNDSFRIKRVVGLYFSSAKKMDELYNPKVESIYDPIYFILTLERSELFERINERVDMMLATGFKEEVSKLIKLGYDERIKAMRSLGYRTLFLEAQGVVAPDKVADIIKKESRAFAKRQMTWFKHIDGKIDIEVQKNDSAQVVAEKIFEHKKFQHAIQSIY